MNREPDVVQIPIGDYQNTAYVWEGRDPPLLFCHATEFHGRVWDSIIRKLPRRRAVSVDLRGHGLSTKTEPPYPWDSFVGDVLEVIDYLGLDHVIGIGLSMGGHVVTATVPRSPKVLSGLVLVEPSLFDPHTYKTEPPDPGQDGRHPVSRRRNEWDSPAERFERLRRHPNFSTWEEEALADYCTHGLHKNPETGKYNLACPPLVEASMYGSYIDPQILDRLPEIELPIRILLAGRRTEEDPKSGFGSSVTREDLVDRFPNATARRLEDLSHFLPMEDSQLVADEIESFCGGLNLG